MNALSLKLADVDGDVVAWEDADGDEILTTRGPVTVQLTRWEDLDLQSAWYQARTDHVRAVNAGLIPWTPQPNFLQFEDNLRRMTIDMDDVVIVWCENCNEPLDSEDATALQDGASVCQSCYDSDYTTCADCCDVVAYDSTTGTLHDENVCDRCKDYHYYYCMDCDGYYHHNYSDEHHHNENGCDCESPAQVFAMPNGEGTLSQDERVAVSLPSGVISEQGMYSIASVIREEYYKDDTTSTTDEERTAAYQKRSKWYYLASDVHRMDTRWQTKDGNFTKRLSKLAHKSQGLKIPPAILTRIGNIARDNSQGADVSIEITRDLNLSAADFYHEDSCWWQSYSESRCALKTNGGIGLRTFTQYNSVSGRAWIMPLRLTDEAELVPTFDAMAADAYIVFNGYGDLDGYTPARIVAQMTGLTYAKVGFGCGPMYVNSDSGYLVASQDVLTRQAERGFLRLDVDQHSALYNREQLVHA